MATHVFTKHRCPFVFSALLVRINTRQVSSEDCGTFSLWFALCLCSAGVGRTGTFIVIDAMIEMMYAEQKVDVFGFVSKIREQRSQLIQTDVSWRRSECSHVYHSVVNVKHADNAPFTSELGPISKCSDAPVDSVFAC